MLGRIMRFIVDWWHGKIITARIFKLGQRKIILAGDEESIKHWTSKLAHTLVSFVIRNEAVFVATLLAGLGYLIINYVL